jgi:hypothetical protein
MATAILEKLTAFTKGIDQLAPPTFLKETSTHAGPANGNGNPWEGVIDQLFALRQLEPDWDGMGAEPPTPSAIEFAFWLMLTFRYDADLVPSRVVAGPNGTVVLEWQSPAYRLEVEVREPFHVECLFLRQGQEPRWHVIKVE